MAAVSKRVMTSKRVFDAFFMVNSFLESDE